MTERRISLVRSISVNLKTRWATCGPQHEMDLTPLDLGIKTLSISVYCQLKETISK